MSEKWERVQDNRDRETTRLRVPTGWIYIVTEKGDLVAFKTHGEMTFEAMRRIGYDGVAIGNPDFDPFGIAGIRTFERVLGQPLLCLNIVRADETPEFTGARVVEAGGIKIGLIGLIMHERQTIRLPRMQDHPKAVIDQMQCFIHLKQWDQRADLRDGDRYDEQQKDDIGAAEADPRQGIGG